MSSRFVVIDPDGTASAALAGAGLAAPGAAAHEDAHSEDGLLRWFVEGAVRLTDGVLVAGSDALSEAQERSLERSGTPHLWFVSPALALLGFFFLVCVVRLFMDKLRAHRYVSFETRKSKRKRVE